MRSQRQQALDLLTSPAWIVPLLLMMMMGAVWMFDEEEDP